MPEDSPELRRDLEARLAALDHAVCLQLVRFRRHTARSAAGHVADVVADELFGGDAAPVDGPTGRAGEPGCVVVVLSEQGEIGRIEAHPVASDFESFVVPQMARACIRLGAAFEVWVEQNPVVRKEVLLPASSGYRDRQMIDGDAITRSEWALSNDGVTIRHERSQPPRVWAAALLGALCVVCFPFTILALLFRESRETLLGMMQGFLHGWRRTWEWSVRESRASLTWEEPGRTTQTHELHLRDTILMTWPAVWSGPAKARHLVAIQTDGVRRWSCPEPEVVEAFLDAHR